MKSWKEFESNESGEINSLPIVNVAVSLILVATLGVAAWQLLGNANYTGVDATTKTLVQTVVGVVGAIAAVLIILRSAR